MRALCWSTGFLFFCLCIFGCEGCLEEERTALLQLRDSFNYPNGSYLVEEWVGHNCCDWYRVSCDFHSSRSQVVTINFYGYMEHEQEKWYPNATLFTHFKELRWLSLYGTNIGGWIMPQALCGLTNLRYLDLSGNNLDDEGLPRCLPHNLSLLEEVYISENRRNISSPLLTALCGLRNLRVLNLSYNNLSKNSLPSCLLHEQSSLETLYLYGCDLEGSPVVLSALCGARNLKNLDLSGNNLGDESLQKFPLYNLSSLDRLDLSYNNIKCSSGSLTALCGSRNLQVLYLHSNDLSNGTLPACLLHEHSSLKTLGLSNSRLKASHDVLTALCASRNLKMLDLSSNNLRDESLRLCPLYNLTSLESLDLSGNEIKGSSGFLSGFCGLKNVQSLNLKDNMIEGNISPCWGKMNSLVSLDLSYNQIAGNISSFSFSNLTSLRSVDFSSNQLDGILPFSMFANLSNLKTISFSNNDHLHVETESPTWIPSFQLIYLYLDNCNLNKHSRGNIPSFISTQYSLQVVSLSYNSLQGTIPSWLFYNFTLDMINLRGNLFGGQFPISNGNKTSTVFSLDISNNRFHGKLPINIDKLFSQLFYFNMSTNNLEGDIPPSFGNLIYLMALDLSSNALVGVPHRLLHNNTRLSQLILSNNNLRSFPRLSNATTLKYLRLDGNCFKGSISISASSFPSLQILDISRSCMSKNISNWLPTLPYLVSLLLGSNHFVGHIPESLCQMQQLRILDLSDNHLSGNIPSCINNITAWKNEDQSFLGIELDIGTGGSTMLEVPFSTKRNSYSYKGAPLSNMTGIDLSMNQLQGEIPTQMGDLIVLRSLNLSYNLLTGHFPKSFQNLKNLESLDLSLNKLVGTIPSQITQLHFLSVFYVAFNNLSGRIPFEKNFLTFTESSYIGNSGLCGPPLKVNCSLLEDPSSHGPHNENEKEKDGSRLLDNDLFFYSCVAICYLLGFWGFIAPLLLSGNWRRRYFGIMDGCFEWCNERFVGLLFYIKSCR